MPMPSNRAYTLVAALLTLACVADPPAPQADAKQAEPEKAEPEKPADPNELSPEELALIEADPKDLTVEQRRKRAYALRKKIMQNPDSESAKTLMDAQR